MDLLIISAAVVLFLLSVLLLILCIICAKLIARMPQKKQDAVVTQLYGLAEVIRYGIKDGKLDAAELRQIMASILSVIAALKGVRYDEVEKEFSDSNQALEEDDAYFLCITDENIIPQFQQYSNDELFVKDEMGLPAGKSHIYGIISAPKNARLTLTAESKNQTAPAWNYSPVDETTADIVRIPFRIMYPEGGWERGQHTVYFTLSDESCDVVYDFVSVEITVS